MKYLFFIIQAAFFFCFINFVSAQTTIADFDFNNGVVTGTLPTALSTATNVTCVLSVDATTAGAWTAPAGTATAGSPFTANGNNKCFSMTASNGATPYWLFTLGGSDLSGYGSYKVYFQGDAVTAGTSANTLTLWYSTDGVTYTSFGAMTLGVSGTWVNQVFDLSAVVALNSNPTAVYFKIIPSGNAGTAAVRLDNFEVQAVCPTTNYTFSTASIALSVNTGCCLSNYTFTQTSASGCYGPINTGVTVTVNFPAGTNASTFTNAGSKFNTKNITVSSIVSPTQITFTTPGGSAVAENTSFTIVLANITNGSNLAAATATVSVPNTSTGTASYSSYAITTTACNQNYAFTTPSITLCDNYNSDLAQYTFTQTNNANCQAAINSGLVATVTFPAGTDVSTFTSGTFNGSAIASYTVVSAIQFNFTTPTSATSGTTFTIVLNGITNGSNITNGNATVSITNNSGGVNSYSTYTYSTIPTGTGYTFTSPTVALSGSSACATSVATYTFTQTLPSTNASIASGVTATVNFITGTDATSMTGGTFNGSSITSYTVVSGTQINFTTPTNVTSACPPTTSFTIILTGITDPFGTAGTCTVSIPNTTGGTDSYTAYPVSFGGSKPYYANSTGQTNPTYAQASGSGLCYNNLTAGSTYCFSFTYPSSGNLDLDFITSNCSGSIADYDNLSPASSACAPASQITSSVITTYDNSCTSIFSGLTTGTTCMTVGSVYNVCYTIPVGCGGLNICPLIGCSSGGCGAILPIDLLYFAAVDIDGKVQLNWATATEMNNNYFTIERSQNAADFEPIATIKGADNSNSTLYYQTFDDKPLSGVSYYRLKQTDFNGASVSFGIVSVRNSSDISVYPTLSSGLIAITGIEDKNSEVIVYSMMGEKVFSIADNHESTVDLTFLPGGIYIIQVTTEKTSYTQKLVIQK